MLLPFLSVRVGTASILSFLLIGASRTDSVGEQYIRALFVGSFEKKCLIMMQSVKWIYLNRILTRPKLHYS